MTTGPSSALGMLSILWEKPVIGIHREIKGLGEIDGKRDGDYQADKQQSRTKAIKIKATPNTRLAEMVRIFEDIRVCIHPSNRMAAITEPAPIALNISPQPSAFNPTSLRPMTGISEGIREIKKAKRAFLLKTICTPGECRTYRIAVRNDSRK